MMPHSNNFHHTHDRDGCVQMFVCSTSVSRRRRRRLSLESSLFCSLSRSRSSRSLATLMVCRRSVASALALSD